MKLRDVIESVPTFACTALPDGSMDFVNRHWQDYTGLSGEKSVGSGWQAVLRSSNLGRHAEKWHASLAIGEPFEPELHRHRLTAEGQDRWFLVRGVPQRGGRGKIFKWYGVAIDVEDRKRAKDTIGADAAHANRVNLLGELAASLSHELKQPIAAAIINANAALRFLRRDQPDVEQACETTRRIIKNSTHAIEIIDRLWSLYKKSPPQRECIDVNASIRDVGELLGGKAHRHAVSMRTDLAADSPMVVADPVQLQQVLMNLMLNGIEAMEGTGGVLTVNTQLGQEGQVLISVSDTGVGLPAEKPDQIFNAFFTTKPQGSGMGLAVSRCIVESHGGHLWATANDGQGATFHFTLPTATQTEPEAAAFVARETGSKAGRPRVRL